MKYQETQPKAFQAIIEQITVDKLDAIISDDNYAIIDVRGSSGIEKQGNIPGAVNMPFESINAALDRHHKKYDAVFDRDVRFLFCCTGGVMSYMAAIKAQEQGIKNVYNLEGGHSAWLKYKEAVTAQ